MTQRIKADSMLALLQRYAAKQPDALCIADPDEQLGYGAFFARVQAKAARLAAMGVQRGDRVTAISAQRGDFLALMFAAHYLGAVFVPLEQNLPAERAQAIRAATGAKLTLRSSHLDGEGTGDYAALPTGLPQPGDPATILFTTGTTGVSKGIELCHRAEVAVAQNVYYGTQMEADTVELIPLPISHSYGLRHFFGLLLGGCATVLCDGVALAADFFSLMDRYGVNALSLTPAAVNILLQLTGDRLGDYAGKLRYLQLGTAGVDPVMKDRLRDLLPHSRLYQYYSSTEAGCACIFDFRDDRSPRRVGRPAVNATFAIMDDRGAVIRSDERHWGFIACKGPMIMTGYYGDPQLTAQTIIDGYVRSQDVGYIDGEGYLCFVGRAGDVINTGGYKVSPEEVEGVAMRFGGIRECALVAVSDPLLGQVPALCLVPERPGAPFDEAGLLAHLAAHLEHYKLPQRVALIDAVPRNHLGKVVRSHCLALLAQTKEDAPL